jgi:paraquat-inducible protein B
MSRTIEQKLSTLAGLQKQIEKYLKEIQDEDVHFTLHRTKEELHKLLLEIDTLNKMASRLAHAVALSTEEDTAPLWVNETYRQWADHNKKRWLEPCSD